MPEDEILQVCECVYEVVERQDEEGNTYSEKVLVTQCDYCNYKLFKEANINEDLWDLCTVVDGVIYTPQIETTPIKTTEEKLVATQKMVLNLQEQILDIM